MPSPVPTPTAAGAQDPPDAPPAPGGWTDPSPHRSGSVRVDGVRLHYLEWGEGGKTLLLFPGYRQTPHVYDELAPELADEFRVVALAPRGHGESETPEDGYSVARFVEDVRGFLDARGIGRAALGGHSIGGAVLSPFATRYPERTAGLVYLDAVYDYTGWGAMQSKNPVQPPGPDTSGGKSADDAEREWLVRFYYGFWGDAQEADWRLRRADPEAALRGRVLHGFVRDVIARPVDHRGVRAPALALCAAESLETTFAWLDPQRDAARRAEAQRYLDRVRRPWQRRGIERFRREVPHAEVVEIPSHHFLFLAHRDRVVHEIRRFLRSLP